MKLHKMTKWEVGNDLSYCADILADKEHEIRSNGYLFEADIIKSARYEIGKVFNKLRTHSFALPENDLGEIEKLEEK